MKKLIRPVAGGGGGGGGGGGNVACYSTENMEFHLVYVCGERGDAGLDKRIRGEVRWKGG